MVKMTILVKTLLFFMISKSLIRYICSTNDGIIMVKIGLTNDIIEISTTITNTESKCILQCSLISSTKYLTYNSGNSLCKVSAWTNAYFVRLFRKPWHAFKVFILNYYPIIHVFRVFIQTMINVYVKRCLRYVVNCLRMTILFCVRMTESKQQIFSILE